MIKGIHFEIKAPIDKVLYEIFKGIDIKNYDWGINNCDVYNECTGEIYFKEKNISGEELYNKISKEDCFIMFLKLIGIKKGDNIEAI